MLDNVFSRSTEFGENSSDIVFNLDSGPFLAFAVGILLLAGG